MADADRREVLAQAFANTCPAQRPPMKILRQTGVSGSLSFCAQPSIASAPIVSNARCHAGIERMQFVRVVEHAAAVVVEDSDRFRR